MLTALQQRVARLVLQSSPDPELALAGGAALIARGLVDRTTIDLDFFTSGSGIESLTESVVAVLEQSGLDVSRERLAPTFARLIVSDGTEQTLVDIGQDARVLPVEQSAVGPTLSAEELAADKMLALLMRALARDYVDVYMLARRFTTERLCELAKEKDREFDETVFAGMLGAIERLDRQEFEVDDATLEALRAFFSEWGSEL